MKILAIAFLFAGVSGLALGAFNDFITFAPEIDPGSAGSSLALLGGALLMIRGRKK